MYHYNFNIKVAHINHQIRETAMRDQLFVEKMCGELGVKFYCKSVDVEKYGRENKLSCEEAGRKIRYDFFYELAGEKGKIATAHNANDNAETVLMRFFRGTGLKGLCGIAYSNGNIVRPMLNISRHDIEQYITDCHLEHITDETNLVPIYTRNKIRLQTIPMIEKDFNPNFCNTINTSIENFNDDMGFIDEMTEKSYERICSKTEKGIAIRVDEFLKLHKAIQKRVIMSAIANVKKNTVDISSQNIADVHSLFEKNHNAMVNVFEDTIARRDYGTVEIEPVTKTTKATPTPKEIIVKDNMNSTISVNGKRVRVTIAECKEATNTPATMYVPISQLDSLVFRIREPGDVYVKEQNMRLSLRKHLSNLKMSMTARNEMMFLYSNKSAIWIMGYSAMRLKNRAGTFVKLQVVNR